MFGYVFYPDGGCYPQNEHSGAGIHGYRWNLDLTAKGIGNTTHSATFRGYEVKGDTFDFANKEAKAAVADFSREAFSQWVMQEPEVIVPNGVVVRPNLNHRVPVERYYDGFIPLDFGGTNNTAELNATVHTLERIIKEPDFHEAALVVIRQDARYVVDGHNLYLPNWMEKKFTRRDGSVVLHEAIWMRLYAAVHAIKELGAKVIFEWVQGHSNCPGNNSADVLATAARIIAKSPKEVAVLDSSFRISDAQDYWASRGDLRHPMMCFRYAYLDVSESGQERRDYYLSTQGKSADISGKRTSDDGFAVVRCNAQRHLEDIVAKQSSLPREIDYKFHIDLDNVYGNAGRYIDLYGTDFLHRAVSNKRHLQTYGKELLTTELHPPFLVDRVFDNMDILCDFLDNYRDTEAPTLASIDITDSFFDYKEEEVKVKKGEEARTRTVCTLKSEITVGYSKQSVKGRWKEANGEIQECDVTLRLGVDLPDRNALRRLEEKNPRVLLLTNTLGPGSFMYAVVIEAGEDVGIWSGINSSIRVTAKTAPSKAK